MPKIPELLAPAGSFAALEAAIAEFQVIANQVHIKEKTFEYINKVINENKILK